MITKSGYLYKVSFEKDGGKQELEFKSFEKLSQGDIVVRLLDGSNNINIANLQVTEEVVVWGMDKDKFLEAAHKTNRKSNLN